MSAQDGVARTFMKLIDGARLISESTPEAIRDLLETALDQVTEAVDDWELNLLDERDYAQSALRDALALIDLAVTHHEDAQRFGWSERETEAWRLVNTAYGEMAGSVTAA